ncbi:MAG: 50S ribosomal protein L9 [Candidatus Magasanikbacteria bacterium]|nr:50S ribosomal protein L9 [Candidatus Magasanikbacteria bacterium]
MKVILLAKVAGLGEIDDIKEVAEGYAVNFLFPRHLAVLASTKSVSELNADKRRKAKEEETDLKTQQSMASRLDGLPVTFTEKTNEAGFLYAGVGAQKIFDSLKKLGFEIDKNRISVNLIKEPGEYSATIKLRHGLEAKIHVIVNSIKNNEGQV